MGVPSVGRSVGRPGRPRHRYKVTVEAEILEIDVEATDVRSAKKRAWAIYKRNLLRNHVRIKCFRGYETPFGRKDRGADDWNDHPVPTIHITEE